MIYDPEVQTLAELTEIQGRRFPHRVALICGEQSVTYAQLRERVASFARRLLARGVEPGGTVGVLSKESVDSVALLLALARCGAVAVPINWRLAPAEVGFITRSSQCSALFVSEEHAAAALPLPDGCELASIDELARGEPSAPTAEPWPEVAPRDIAVHIYTSGTTGFPKAVELPHDSFFAIAREFWRREQRWLDWSDHEVGLCMLPTFHVGGLWWLVRMLASGGTAVLMPHFVGWRAIEAIERHQVTMTAAVPAMLHVMLSEPDVTPERLRSLRVVGYGGSPMPPALLARVRAYLRAELCQVYGLSETGNMAVCLTPADHLVERRLRAAGRALPGVSIKVVDSSGRSLLAGEVGEICIRSPASMRGYWNDADATRATLRDGWVYTGDAGYLDEEGYVFVSDRIKDMICCGGEKVWPAEVEAVLSGHPGVREVAVIGVPHPEWGESVRAVVVPAGPAPLELRELRLFARGRLADFKLPSSLQLADSLPRNPAGKVQKRLLREASPSGPAS